MPEPTYGPYCGNKNIVAMDDWIASSNGQKDTYDYITEYQCMDCNGRSFWI